MVRDEERKRARKVKRRKHHWPRLTRDGLIFGVGLGGIIYEATLHEGSPRDTLLIVFMTMIGLPAFLRMDDKRDRTNQERSREEDDHGQR